MRARNAFALAALLLAAAGCNRPASNPAASAMVPDRAPNIRGVITRMTAREVAQAARTGAAPGAPREDEVGTVQIEAPGGGMRDRVVVTAVTRVLRRQEGRLVPADWGDLRVGQPVEAWYTGPVAESDPRQATAGVLVIREGAG
jgi:hypothetical protein